MKFLTLVVVFFLGVIAGEAVPSCTKGCPRIYAPVCGTNTFGANKAFGNKCELDNYNCNNPNNQYNNAYSGQCECPSICTMDYTPVCGSDSKGLNTFGNSCAFNAYNCEHINTQYQFLYSGECKL